MTDYDDEEHKTDDISDTQRECAPLTRAEVLDAIKRIAAKLEQMEDDLLERSRSDA